DPGGRSLGARPQRPGKDERGLTTVGRQVPVAARPCEAVRLPIDRHADDLDGYLQVKGHLPGKRQLLKVLLGGGRGVRSGELKRPQHDGEYAMEEARTARAL